MQLAQIKEELNNTSSNNAYPRFPCNYSFLAANSFYIIPPKPQATSPNNYDFASDPADATGDPVNNSDPSGELTISLCDDVAGEALFGAGIGGTGEACMQNAISGNMFTYTPSFNIGNPLWCSGTLGLQPFGYGFGVDASVMLQFSTASTPADLAGPFRQVSVSASLFDVGLTGAVFWGKDHSGNEVVGFDVGYSPGLDASFLDGVTNTWVKSLHFD